MAQVLFANNAYTTLSVGCAVGDTTLTVTSSAAFPSVTTASGNWFYACLQDTFANLEIVKVTNITGTTWTVTRAIGGTSARIFASGSVVELRLTAETLNDIYSTTVSGNIQNSTPQWLTSVSGTDTITASLTPALTAYTAGQTFRLTATGTNTTTSVTLNVNGLGAKNITKVGNTALSVGDLVLGSVYELSYDGTQFQIVNSTLVDALRDVPANSQGANYTLALTDRGKSIDFTGSTGQTITIPANSSVAFPIGATITVTNTTANSLSIAIITDTLRQAGTTNTGTRTLLNYGVGTLRKIAATTWIISGSGVT